MRFILSFPTVLQVHTAADEVSFAYVPVIIIVLFSLILFGLIYSIGEGFASDLDTSPDKSSKTGSKLKIYKILLVALSAIPLLLMILTPMGIVKLLDKGRFAIGLIEWNYDFLSMYDYYLPGLITAIIVWDFLLIVLTIILCTNKSKHVRPIGILIYVYVTLLAILCYYTLVLSPGLIGAGAYHMLFTGYIAIIISLVIGLIAYIASNPKRNYFWSFIFSHNSFAGYDPAHAAEEFGRPDETKAHLEGYVLDKDKKKNSRKGVIASTSIMSFALVVLGIFVLIQRSNMDDYYYNLDYNNLDYYSQQHEMDEPIEIEEQEMTASIDEAWVFLRQLYNYSLYQDDDFLEKYCSPKVLSKLKDDYEYEGDGYANWDFRSGYQDGYSNDHTLVTVSEEEDGWFVYTGIDMGWLFKRSVQLVKKDDDIRIADLYLGDISEKSAIKSTTATDKEKHGTIPESIVLDPTISETDFLKVLGFGDVDEDSGEYHIIEKNLVSSDHTRQILSINTCYGAHSWYNLYFIDLDERSYNLFGSFSNIEFDSRSFTVYERTSEIINENTDIGTLTTEKVYDYNGELLSSVSTLSTIDDDYDF